MSLALLQSAFLFPAELLLQNLLALDPLSARRLHSLEGRTLAIHCSKPAMDIYLSVGNGKLRLAALHEGECDASLQGSATALLGLLLREENITNLRSSGVELRGNTGFVQELQSLLRTLEPDWEYQLSKVLGDVPARALTQSTQAGTGYVRQGLRRLGEDLDEFIHEESGLLPTQEALAQHYADITALRLQLDRLQARLALLAR